MMADKVKASLLWNTMSILVVLVVNYKHCHRSQQ